VLVFYEAMMWEGDGVFSAKMRDAANAFLVADPLLLHKRALRH
jgi:hypothetical protein